MQVLFDVKKDLIISIHAPVKGATPTTFKQYCTRSISIHAPVKGATGLYHIDGNWLQQFQSTHP